MWEITLWAAVQSLRSFFGASSYRLHSFPRLLRSAPSPPAPSARLFHTFIIQLIVVSVCVPSMYPDSLSDFLNVHTLRFHFCAVKFYGFDKCILSYLHFHCIIPNSFIVLKILCALPLQPSHPPPWTPGNHWSLEHLHSLAFSRMSCNLKHIHSRPSFQTGLFYSAPMFFVAW